ncbi:hypothetical protein I8R02_27800 [Klebsiella pneumoniae]|nr:hypothetical protein [Klebsiella pneumoniae]
MAASTDGDRVLLVVGVGHPVMNAWRGSWSSRSFPSRCAVIPAESFQSRDVGVTQPAILAAPPNVDPLLGAFAAAPNPLTWLLSIVVGVGKPVIIAAV